MRIQIGTRAAAAPRLAAALLALLAARPATPAVAPPATAHHAAGHPAAGAPRALPPIVFVSRRAPEGADAGQIPGLGPHGRTLAPGGRLMVRERDGRVRALLPEGALWDVCDPSISPDARTIAFAGTPAQGGAWRIYRVGVDGRGLTALTRDARADDAGAGPDTSLAAVRGDDVDPCWIGAHELVFASTRFPMTSEYGAVPATNLYRVADSGTPPVRLTTERNGIEEPAFDRSSGRVVAARWWTNRWRASDLDPAGVTTDPARALPADSANLWQVVALDPAHPGPVLAAGDPRSRAACMGTQPALLPGGAIVCVYARHFALTPDPGGVGIEIFGGPRAPRFPGLPLAIGPPERLAGPVLSQHPGDPYHDARGLAAPQACAPAALADGRILFAYDPGARGDFGVWVIRADGSGRDPVVDLPGTLELDPAPITPWDPGPHAWRAPPNRAVPLADNARAAPARTTADLVTRPGGGFTFHALNIFANAAVEAPLADAPPAAVGLRMRFFAALLRPGVEGGDSAVLVREVPLERGEVDARDLPAGVPMFEQVVRPDGRVLQSAHGPAHVAGFNSGSGGERRCVGCHIGHSAMAVPASAERARWFNAAPDAQATASSVHAGSGGARAAVDRRSRGAANGWCAAGGAGEQWLRLSWPLALEVGELVLHGPDAAPGATGAAWPCELRLLRAGRVVATAHAAAPQRRGTRVRLTPVSVDAIELRFAGAGRGARHAPALAEVEVLARLP